MTAIFSPCSRYRYRLERDLGAIGSHHDSVAFIMLNPSTADAERDDPTIRRCIGYARLWGYRRLIVGNAYAWRSTDPAGLWTAPDPVGPDNAFHLEQIARDAELVVCACVPVDPNRSQRSPGDVAGIASTADALALATVPLAMSATPRSIAADGSVRNYHRQRLVLPTERTDAERIAINAEISRRILATRLAGATMKDAMDSVLGAGTYDAFVDDLYHSLRAKGAADRAAAV